MNKQDITKKSVKGENGDAGKEGRKRTETEESTERSADSGHGYPHSPLGPPLSRALSLSLALSVCLSLSHTHRHTLTGILSLIRTLTCKCALSSTVAPFLLRAAPLPLPVAGTVDALLLASMALLI